jgi:uncharacterized protein
VVRLIRSKGVRVNFFTQSPLDVPETVPDQLGNRVNAPSPPRTRRRCR